MEVFGPEGPILDFATALEASQAKAQKGRLTLDLLRDGKALERDPEGRNEATAPTRRPTPTQCAKSERILDELLAYLAEHQREDGSWGSPPHDTFAPLALLASGKPKYLPAVREERGIHARTTARGRVRG